jgi:hypothetical protein
MMVQCDNSSTDQYEGFQYNIDLEIRIHSHVYMTNAVMALISNTN